VAVLGEIGGESDSSQARNDKAKGEALVRVGKWGRRVEEWVAMGQGRSEEVRYG
jgi:hypothetical protein